MTPPDNSPERGQALASIARHGALGACVIDLRAARTELADMTTSLVSSVLATVAAARERDRLRAQVAAVRALLLTGDPAPTCADLLAVLDADGPDGAGSRAAPPQERVEPQVSTSGPPDDSVPANATPHTEGAPRE